MKIIFFYLFVLTSYFSITGYGLLINDKYLSIYKKKKNLFELTNFILGIIFLSIFGFILYLFSINNLFVNLAILFFGIYLFYSKSYETKIHDYYVNILILIFIFSGLIISKTHEDFIPYHFPFIEIVTNSKLIFGLGKVEINYIYTPLISYIQKIFVLPLLDYKMIHVPIFLIYFSIISFLLKEIYFNKKINLLFLFLLIFYLTKFNRLSEFGYDYLVAFLISIIVIYLISDLKNNNKINYFLYCLIFIYALSLKNIAIFFIPILFAIIFFSEKINVKNLKLYFKENKLLLVVCLFLICIFIIENFLKSGCFFNFIIFTCLENKTIFWSVNNSEIIDISNHVRLWAKGFYHQQEHLLINKDNYMNGINWVSNWYRVHFNYKVLEYISQLLLVFIICYSISLSKNRIVEKFKDFNTLLLISSLISILLWFFVLPQLRFGSGLIIIFFVILLSKLIGINDRIFKSKKIILSLICFSFIIFNIKNINRIHNEITRSDKYQFNNFPFISVTDYAKPHTFQKRYEKSLQKRFK